MPRPFARRRCAFAAALLALSAWCADAGAWGRRGHAVIGDIASQLLKPEATFEVDVLLRDDVGADGRPSGLSTLGQVASWADDVRTLPDGRASYAYHFDDIPLCDETGAASVVSNDKSKYCADGRCASEWLKKQIAVLGDKSQSTRARNEALKWVVHLVGDLHQPLHASNHDDRGGNDVRVTFLGRRADDPVDGKVSPPYNLHTAWDRLIPNRLLDRMGDEAFDAALPDEATRRDWRRGDVDTWTLESHAIARDFVYPALPGGFRCGTPLAAVVAIDEGYVLAASDVVAAQLRRAAVRLAEVLNDTLVAPVDK